MDTADQETLSRIMRELSRRGHASMTPEERRERAYKAAMVSAANAKVRREAKMKIVSRNG